MIKSDFFRCHPAIQEACNGDGPPAASERPIADLDRAVSRNRMPSPEKPSLVVSGS